ncbi:hypothetical protein I350_06287 [Cryptococcus amylolentus CBS 6273]|uniref:Uncharacterized protein n=1 Tax=Cryptococcus amylolentus CBS 6273 TaxID=1296118 RepID=A0A1E3JMV8_9TREE|nr:hypothetical protein I350_06287 [Cryptococcus amylolentus CBS 6273]
MSGLGTQNLVNDIALLRTIPPSSLPLAKAQSPTTSNTPRQTLEAFAPSKATPEDSQRLAKAYVQEMKRVNETQGKGEGEEVGERIDQLRALGEDIQNVLGDVKDPDEKLERVDDIVSMADWD